ncbi:MAG TPA: aminotransferase class V-fold PLP-dependent enzyme [Allosphingosinicella sp.]
MADLANDPWAGVAAEFSFVPGLTYLNTGSEGSMPRRLQAVLGEAVAKWASSPSQAFFFDPLLDSKETANRARMAAFVGARPQEIVLTDNTTMGLAMVIIGFPWRPRDEVVTTQHDHFSMYSPLGVAASRVGIDVVELPLPSPPERPAQIIDAFEAAITPNTRAFCFSHITFTTGLRMPVSQLCALARSRGIATIVDGAHALGMLDLSLHDLGCDFYAASGHKWLNGPPATGILYIRDAQTNPWNLAAVISEKSASVGNGLTIAEALQKRGELGGPAYLTLARTADFADTIGKRAIETRILTLSDIVRRRAAELWGEQCLYSVGTAADTDAMRSGLVAFLPSRDPLRAYDADFVNGIVQTLVQRGIWVLCTQFPNAAGDTTRQMNALRVSTSLYNNEDDVDRLFAALRAIYD